MRSLIDAVCRYVGVQALGNLSPPPKSGASSHVHEIYYASDSTVHSVGFANGLPAVNKFIRYFGNYTYTRARRYRVSWSVVANQMICDARREEHLSEIERMNPPPGLSWYPTDHAGGFSRFPTYYVLVHYDVGPLELRNWEWNIDTVPIPWGTLTFAAAIALIAIGLLMLIT